MFVGNKTAFVSVEKLPIRSKQFWFFLLLLWGLAFTLLKLPFWEPLDDTYNDHWRQQMALASSADEQILIIEINDSSLAQMESVVGKWPWPRSVHGYLVDGLLEAGAKAIVFDMLFSERDIYRQDDDAFFNEVVSGRENVFYASSLLGKSSPVDAVDLEMLPSALFTKRAVNQSTKVNIALPWVIEPDSWNVGLINMLSDWDGSVRRYPVVTSINGWQFHSLPSRVVSFIKPSFKVDDEIIQLKYKGSGLVPYNSLSYADARILVEHQQQLETFKDKIIIIGATATGLHDLRKSPIAQNYPGTSILAAAIDNLKNQEQLTKVDSQIALLVCLLFVSLLWLIVGVVDGYRKQLFYSGVLFFVSGIALFSLSEYFSHQDRLFPAASVFSVFTALLVLLMFYRGLSEYLNKRHALSTFSRFMDPVVVKQLVDDEDWQETISNKSSQVSVLFSDIRGFTTLSEKRSAEEIMSILNRYFDSQVEAIFANSGTLDKFIGDAIMAFWGAPIESETHARDSINAALNMVDNLLIFRKTLAPELQGFDVGIGIHSGEAVVGMLGSAKRFDYTAIGDTVNLASRIEGKTKDVARILVSESTKALCEDEFEFEYKGQFAVKGREEEVKLFEPSRKQEGKNGAI